MPKAQEEALKRVAAKYAKQGKLKRKKNDSLEEAKDRFVYGTLRKMGWKPSREKR
jgi:hypothetical protein